MSGRWGLLPLGLDAREYKRDKGGRFATTNSGGGAKKSKPKSAKIEKPASKGKESKQQNLHEALSDFGITSKSDARTKNVDGKRELYRNGKSIGRFDAKEGWALVNKLKSEKQPGRRKIKSSASASPQQRGKELAAALLDRGRFDPMLKDIEATATAAEMKAIFREMTGYDIYRPRNKAEIVKRLQNWQREAELDDDLRRAQAKLPV